MGKPRWPDQFHDFDRWTWGAKGLEILTRSTPLTDAEWESLIERRVERIKPHLDSMSLEKLGDTKCLMSGSSYHAIGDSTPEIVCDLPHWAGLNTQGIFGFSSRSKSDGQLFIWGLTRKSPAFVLTKVEWKWESGYKGRGYERASRLTTHKTTLSEIREIGLATYKEIWERLGEAVFDWMVDRHRLLQPAEELARAFAAEDAALKELEKNILPKQLSWYCDSCKTKGMLELHRGERVPVGGEPHSGLEWAHRQSSQECKGYPRVYLDPRKLDMETLQKIVGYRESNPERPPR